MKQLAMRDMKGFLLDVIQRGRLARLLEDYVEDYGIKEIARYTSRKQSYLMGIINEAIEIDNWANDSICKCLAINPNYVLFDKNPIYKDIPKH